MPDSEMQVYVVGLDMHVPVCTHTHTFYFYVHEHTRQFSAMEGFIR